MMVILVLLPHNAPFAIEALPITRPDILVHYDRKARPFLVVARMR
jgi:hypothetical protein